MTTVLEDTNASVLVMEKGLGTLEELKMNYKVSRTWSRVALALPEDGLP
jgi:hypothetical protein